MQHILCPWTNDRKQSFPCRELSKNPNISDHQTCRQDIRQPSGACSRLTRYPARPDSRQSRSEERPSSSAPNIRSKTFHKCRCPRKCCELLPPCLLQHRL